MFLIDYYWAINYIVSNQLIFFVVNIEMRTKDLINLDCYQELSVLSNDTKHAALARLMENQIRQMRHGERLPAARDLIRKIGISQSTYDHALNELEKKELIIRRRGSGIYINKAIRHNVVRRAIGVIVSDISDPFCALLIKGIEKQLSDSNNLMILCNGHHHFQAELEKFHALREKIEGIIIVPTTVNVHNPEYVNYFSRLVERRELPFLLVDITIPGVNAYYVGFDNFRAFSEMAQLIASSKVNFRKIFYLGVLESLIGAERVNGFKAGLKALNYPDEFLNIVNVSLPVSGIPLAAEDFPDEGPVLAISGSPLVLPHLLAFCSAHNLRIPDDVVVAGVVEENIRDYVNVPVIEWIKPSIRLGELAAKTIKSIIDGKQVRQITKLPMEYLLPKSMEGVFNMENVQQDDC